MRKTESCINCGEVREMAAHGLCFSCYRREERAEDQRFAVADRHNPAIRREHKKLFRGFTSVMVGLSDLSASARVVRGVRDLIEPLLDPIAPFLASRPHESTEAVDCGASEQKPRAAFTVHKMEGHGRKSRREPQGRRK